VAAHKGNQYAKGAKGNTKPKTLYKSEYAEQARKLGAMGGTDKQIADFFSVSVQTLNNWKKKEEDLVLALKDGKDQYDTSLVEAALRDRAIGYSHKAVDIRVVNGEIVETEYVKHYPPDPTAAIFWLKNRNRDRWKDKHGIDHSVNEEASLAGLLKSISGETLRPRSQKGQ